MDKIFYLILILVCIGNVAYIYFKGYSMKRMGIFIGVIMTMFLIYICMNNVYGFRNFFIGVFIFTMSIGLSIMTLCGLMIDV